MGRTNNLQLPSIALRPRVSTTSKLGRATYASTGHQSPDAREEESFSKVSSFQEEALCLKYRTGRGRVFAIVLGRAYVQPFRFHGHAAVGLASALRLLSVVVCGWFSCRGPRADVVRAADWTTRRQMASRQECRLRARSRRVSRFGQMKRRGGRTGPRVFFPFLSPNRAATPPSLDQLRRACRIGQCIYFVAVHPIAGGRSPLGCSAS